MAFASLTSIGRTCREGKLALDSCGLKVTVSHFVGQSQADSKAEFTTKRTRILQKIDNNNNNKQKHTQQRRFYTV